MCKFYKYYESIKQEDREDSKTNFESIINKYEW